MPRNQHQGRPIDAVARGTWPRADLRADATIGAHAAQALARNLHDAMQRTGHTQSSLGAITGMSHSTISRILNGQSFCDIAVLAALEHALNQTLWGGAPGGSTS